MRRMEFHVSCRNKKKNYRKLQNYRKKRIAFLSFYQCGEKYWYLPQTIVV